MPICSIGLPICSRIGFTIGLANFMRSPFNETGEPMAGEIP